MALISRNEYGAVAINERAINKMVVENLLALPESLILCNKKGRVIKNRGNKRIHPDCFDAVEIYKKDKELKIKIYCIIKLDADIYEVSRKLIDSIENDFQLFDLPKPGKITINCKGIMGTELIKKNIEVARNND